MVVLALHIGSDLRDAEDLQLLKKSRRQEDVSSTLALGHGQRELEPQPGQPSSESEMALI